MSQQKVLWSFYYAKCLIVLFWLEYLKKTGETFKEESVNRTSHTIAVCLSICQVCWLFDIILLY